MAVRLWCEGENCNSGARSLMSPAYFLSVLQSIITVSNYEYILSFLFDQAGEIAHELRATGVLPTQPIDPSVEVLWETVVHDGVLASFHQHILSLRIDPELDGDFTKSLICQEAHAMLRNAKTNPRGNVYIATRKTIYTSGGYELDSKTGRTL